MAVADEIAKVVEQEQALVFPAFDETVAFALALGVRERAANEGLRIVCDIRLWDRPLVYFAMPGTSGDNPVWAQRKSNVVRRLLKSSYRVVLEQGRPDQTFPEERALPPADYALSGGGFPVRVQGAGVIGAMTVSGLHQRDDHDIVVTAICANLGLDAGALALPRRN